MDTDDWLSAPFSLKGKKIYVAGHRGLVGFAMLGRLESENCEILTNELDLRVQTDTQTWFKNHKPDVVILAAAKVGGIKANNEQPADFIHDNLYIQTNVIQAAKKTGVQKLLFLGSSCIYPRGAAQPIKEESLLTGPLESTNEAYAIAKIAGIKMCQAYRKQHGCDFISAMPCNLYGPGDRFDENASHVIPALIMKACKGAALNVWGSGRALREFLYIDDLAEALVFLLKNYSGAQQVNIGSGAEITIEALAREIAIVTNFKGRIVFDTSQPDGTPRKLLDSSRILAAGWKPKTSLVQGLRKTYQWYQENQKHADAA